MSRLLSCCALAVLAALPASAQTTRLTNAQLDAYDAARLRLESTAVTEGSSTYAGSGYVVSGRYQGTRRVNWTGYQGRRRLGEAGFFEAAGRPELARRARSVRGRYTTMAVVGGVTALAASGASLYYLVQSSDPDITMEQDDEYTRNAYIAAGVSLPGYLLLYIGGQGVSRNVYHVDTAVDAANSFNRRLENDILDGRLPETRRR